MANPKKRVLGKGLDALIPAKMVAEPSAESVRVSEPGAEQVLELDPHDILPNPSQPRRHFDEEQLQELAASLKHDGIQEPVLVRHVNGRYELVAGERRVRAAIMAGLTKVPALRREVSDSDMLRLGLIENIQREDLNAIEEAQAYRSLTEELGWTQSEVADHVGKKRATVTNTLRLLNLPPDVQECVADGRISMGHARALLAIEAPLAQSAACRKVIAKGWSVRQVERLASEDGAKPTSTPKPKDPNIEHMEDELRRLLGTKVALKPKGPQRGVIEIEYFTLDELDRILAILRA